MSRGGCVARRKVFFAAHGRIRLRSTVERVLVDPMESSAHQREIPRFTEFACRLDAHALEHARQPQPLLALARDLKRGLELDLERADDWITGRILRLRRPHGPKLEA
jgi:hypothetical protein